MDYRNRAAPVALPADAPVAQAIIHPALAPAQRLHAPGQLRLGILDRHAVEEARIDDSPRPEISLGANLEGVRLMFRRAHHRHHVEPVFAGEIEVALVVRRAAEDGPGAVVHQDEVGDIDRHGPVRVERVDHPQPGVEAFLLGLLQRLFRGAHAAAVGAERGQPLDPPLQRPGQRMIRRDRREAGPEQGVVAGGVGLELGPLDQIARRYLKAELQPLRAPDPVALHGAHLLGPLVQPVERRQQLLGHVRDLEEPLGQLAPLDRRARAPALAVDHLLVGQHRVVDRVPVHHRGFARHQPGLQHVEEHRLLLGVVFRVAGGELALPVDAQPHRFELGPHRRDVLVGPFPGVDTALQRRVLGRHAEGVPAHRVQHVEAARFLEPGHHVAHGVVAHMAHVDAPRGVGKHLQHVVFRPGLVAGRGEGAALVPDALPFRFHRAGVVARHRRPLLSSDG